MSYEVSLDVFEGPFDLLLHLISKRKVDVTEVDLAEITTEFLARLEDLDLLELETATHFLVVAATLVELKAARLLPTDEREELEDLLGEARDVLYARLLEYRAFRGAAAVLEHLARRNRGYVAREVALEPRFRRLVPDTDIDATVEDLARLAAAADAAAPPQEIDLDHIRRSYMSIRDAAAAVLQRLPRPGTSASFDEIASGYDRSDRVVLFLSLLELYKLGQLDLDQPTREARLTVRRDEGRGDDVAILVEEPAGGAT